MFNYYKIFSHKVGTVVIYCYIPAQITFLFSFILLISTPFVTLNAFFSQPGFLIILLRALYNLSLLGPFKVQVAETQLKLSQVKKREMQDGRDMGTYAYV